MSGHCPKCGTYCEEDDDRFCGACRTKANETYSDIVNARARIATLETALAAMTADRDGEMWLKKLAWAERDIARARHAEVCKERDAQAEAVSLLAGECSEWRLAHVCSPVSLIDAPIIRARKRTMNNPIARAAVEGER